MVDDDKAREAAAAVIAHHGGDAYAFAAERLAFCRAASFIDGIALWSAVVERIGVEIGTGRPSADG